MGYLQIKSTMNSYHDMKIMSKGRFTRLKADLHAWAIFIELTALFINKTGFLVTSINRDN